MTGKRIFRLLFAQSTNSVKYKSDRRRTSLGCELFEDRVVLSQMGGFSGGGFEGHHHPEGPPAQMGSFSPKSDLGGNLLGALGSLGIAPAGGGLFGHHEFGENHDTPPSTTTDPATTALFTNLKTAMDKLGTDTLALASKSGLTVADMSNLVTDSKTIGATGSTIDKAALNKAVSGLAYTVAGGTDQTLAKADFAAVFIGTTVTQSTIDKTAADIVQAVTDSNVTTTDLDLISADKAAIDVAQKDLTDAGVVPGEGGDCDKSKSATTGPTSTTTAVSTNSTPTNNAISTSKVNLHGASRGFARVKRTGHH